MDLLDYETGGMIGQGVYGIVYEAIKRGSVDEKVVIKVEKIITTSGSWMMENLFAFEMGQICPRHFLKLYDYRFKENCEYSREYGPKMNSKLRKELKELAESKWCIYRLMSRIDSVVEIDPESVEIFSFLAQMFYALEKMHENSWTHNDLHLGNIGYVRTQDSQIQLGEVSVPSFGREYVIIDYGRACHRVIKLPGVDRVFDKYRDLNYFYDWVISTNFWDVSKPIPLDKATAKFKSEGLYDEFEVNPPSDVVHQLLIMAFRTSDFIRIIDPKCTDQVYVKLRLSKPDMLFHATHWDNPVELKKYFAKRAKI